MNDRERLIIANEWKAARKKNQDLMNWIWFKKVSIAVGLFIYLCGGFYWFYPEVLNMLFWPFHYGWLAH